MSSTGPPPPGRRSARASAGRRRTAQGRPGPRRTAAPTGWCRAPGTAPRGTDSRGPSRWYTARRTVRPIGSGAGLRRRHPRVRHRPGRLAVRSGQWPARLTGSGNAPRSSPRSMRGRHHHRALHPPEARWTAPRRTTRRTRQRRARLPPRRAPLPGHRLRLGGGQVPVHCLDSCCWVAVVRSSLVPFGKFENEMRQIVNMFDKDVGEQAISREEPAKL